MLVVGAGVKSLNHPSFSINVQIGGADVRLLFPSLGLTTEIAFVSDPSFGVDDCIINRNDASTNLLRSFLLFFSALAFSALFDALSSAPFLFFLIFLFPFRIF